MKSLARNSSSKIPAYSALEIGTEVAFRDQYSLPRHISGLKIKSHRGVSHTRPHNAPKVCQVSLEQEPKSSLALNIIKYQLGDCALRAKHWENIRSSLERRLIKAKNQENTELIGILQAEYKLLQTST